MRVYDNSINTLQERTFTYERLVKYRNGDPYVIPSTLRNPYIVFSLSSSKYTKNNKFFKQWWGEIDDLYPRFIKATPEVITEEPTEKDETILYKWDGEDTTELKKGDYFYYKNDEIIPYEFRYARVFTYNDIKDMQGLEYVYDLKIVAGQTNYEYLVELLHFYEVDEETFEIDINQDKYIFEANIDEEGHIVWKYRLNGRDEEIPSFQLLKDFAKSNAVKEYISRKGEQEFKDYKEQLKVCKSEEPIPNPDYVEFLLAPSPFNVSSVVKGSVYGY